MTKQKTLARKMAKLQRATDALLEELMHQSYVMARLEKYYYSELNKLRDIPARVHALEMSMVGKRERWDVKGQRWVISTAKRKSRQN